MAKQTDYHLSYNQPAAASYDGWEKQALPVGNGEMGAKVFGLIGEERIQYNEKTLWSGGPQPDSTDYNGGNYQDRYKVLAEIRKALEEGNRQKAKQLAERNLVGQTMLSMVVTYLLVISLWSLTTKRKAWRMLPTIIVA